MAADQVVQLGVPVRPVSVPQLLGLLGSLAELVGEGHDAWRLDVVWTGASAPWYVDLCRQRSTTLGLAGRVDFRAADDLAPTQALPAGRDTVQRLVLLLEPMTDRRESALDDAAGVWDDHVVAAPAPARTVSAAPPSPERTETHRRAAAAYQSVTAPADPYRRSLFDAVA